MPDRHHRLARRARHALGLVPVLWLVACATPDEAPGPLRPEKVFAVTEGHDLVSFNAGAPQRLLTRQALQGLPAGEALAGIDFRVARGVLYALGRSGRLYTLDTASGRLAPVGAAPTTALAGAATGVDFNPAADRVRVVTDRGQNLRLHPDTGALAATDPVPAYAAGDPQAGRAPQLAGAAYTYDPRDDKATTNYAIDRASGTLVRQGSLAGATPVVSPNTGLLFTVGALGTGPLDDAAFDIADRGNTPLAALRSGGRTRLYLLDLASGRASVLGTVGDGQPLRGLAIEP